VRNEGDSSLRPHSGTNCSAEDTEQTNNGSNFPENHMKNEKKGGAEACIPNHIQDCNKHF